MNKHIELFKKISEKYLSLHGSYITSIIKRQKAPSKAEIARCYHVLGQDLSEYSKEINMPKIRYQQNAGRYTILDYVNPFYNHIYKDVYTYRFTLPKVYKNALINSKPSTRIMETKPKKGISFKEVDSIRRDFIKNSFIRNLQSLQYLGNTDYEEYFDTCYNLLLQLIEKADLVYTCETPQHNKGSVILARELNNLLFNQNIMSEKEEEIRYALSLPVADKIMADIRLHKEIMFGEIKHTYKLHR